MKKLLLLATLVLGLSSASAFADALLFAVNATPYDNQMARVRPYLASAGGQHDLSIYTVNQWMTDLRSIPYGFTREWKTPSETLSGAPADCKAKAVALYERMTARGAKNVRLVIGRRTPWSRQTHAWLSWETANGSYVLDPTFNWSAARSSEVGNQNYVPLYAFAGAKKYRASSTLVAQN